MADTRILIVGAGIGGLTLALQLHEAGIECRIVERVAELAPLGVGINILPHASRELCRLGLEPELDRVGLPVDAAVFYTRHGQLAYADPAGRAAGYDWPQYAIHRGELQSVLAAAVRERLGEDAIVLDAEVVEVRTDGDTAVVETSSAAGVRRTWTAEAVVGADGVRSRVRRVLHPEERGLHYTGYMMWRGLHRQPRLLDGRSMVRAGWIEQGKMVIYPIRDYDDGTQLVNWVAEVESPQLADRDWASVGALTDFIDTFAEWTFDWLDVPAMMRATESVLQYPMVDQEPLPFWTRGRVTLLGDAAHPMVPRGSNGAGQAILDTRALTEALVAEASVETALQRYQAERLEATARVVLLNRDNPPDAILRVVADRTGDRPFEDLDAHVDRRELAAIVENYRRVTGSSHEALAGSRAAGA